MNCGQCKHFDLKGSPTRSVGFGLCKVEPNPMMRAARTLSPQNVCRIGKFAKADAVVIQRREREVGRIL